MDHCLSIKHINVSKQLHYKQQNNFNQIHSLSIEWNLIRLGGSAHGIVTKTVHKTLSMSLFVCLNWALCSYFQSDLLQSYIISNLLPLLHASLAFLVLISLIVQDFKSK